MIDVVSIGELVYRQITTPVYSDDRQTYSSGCIVRGDGGAVKVIFLRYQKGKGLIVRCKPSAEIAEVLKKYGRDLKDYIRKMDMRDD